MTSKKLAFLTAFLLTLTIAAAGPNHGLDLAGMDKSVKPGNDFYAYANGTWSKNTPIPPDRAVLGVFRSEERRVGKEWRSRWLPFRYKRKRKTMGLGLCESCCDRAG